MSFSDEFDRWRAKRAAEMRDQGELLASIARQLGYSDSATVRRAIQRHERRTAGDGGRR